MYHGYGGKGIVPCALPDYYEVIAYPEIIRQPSTQATLLITLLDLMKRFQAHDLLNAVRSMQQRALLIGMSKTDPTWKLKSISAFRDSLERCRSLCQQLELPMSALHATQLLEPLRPGIELVLDWNGADRIAGMLATTIENELSLRSFLAVSPEKTKYHSDNVEPFGSEVAASFPSAAYDSVEACKSYALGRNTACVFHLMRVLEIGLTAFANQFNVPSDHTNWHNIIEGIEKAVRGMGTDPSRQQDWKDQQEFFSQAASHFMFIKDAWRNYTAHARGKYTEEEAETILINVRAFIQKLAAKLHE